MSTLYTSIKTRLQGGNWPGSFHFFSCLQLKLTSVCRNIFWELLEADLHTESQGTLLYSAFSCTLLRTVCLITNNFNLCDSKGRKMISSSSINEVPKELNQFQSLKNNKNLKLQQRTAQFAGETHICTFEQSLHCVDKENKQKKTMPLFLDISSNSPSILSDLY